jgi:tRNA uridine 5-carboxymethylaminomethyl modification enzyme
MTNNHFDIIVVGGGHAGTEAAAAAARMGAKTALITQKLSTIGAMSCNPAIGGLGKGHLVREVDALDGLIGRAGDAAAIQFRLLNRRKGPAVQGPRVQVDRKLYRRAILRLLSDYKNLSFIEDECVRLKLDGARVAGIVSPATTYLCGAVILTSGTFLNGRIHVGTMHTDGGRFGDRSVVGLSDQLKALGLRVSRLKTGTPPRIKGSSINFEKLEAQWGDDEPQFMSSLTKAVSAPQVPCFITRTTAVTHDFVRASLHRSALFSGSIKGPGPRYCPSIEDKIVRFGDRESHQIFLEPEGVDALLVYPNGISTSLPEDAQRILVKSIPGLEKAEIVQLGYAIEYDFVNPQELTPTLMTRKLKGLFLAGQINGTTGYEEAAAQGLVAGASAANYVRGKEQGLFERTNSYIGVMIDDLIVKGVTEPYRMFTSRAEYRLTLRADNADERLTPAGIALGLVEPERRRQFLALEDSLSCARRLLVDLRLSATTVREAGCAFEGAEQTNSVAFWASHATVHLKDLRSVCPTLKEIEPTHLARLDADAKYSVYIARQSQDIARQKADEALVLPPDIDYQSLAGLSNEMRAKLGGLRPATVGQASRMEGVTPAALMLLAGYVRRARRPPSRSSRS